MGSFNRNNLMTKMKNLFAVGCTVMILIAAVAPKPQTSTDGCNKCDKCGPLLSNDCEKLCSLCGLCSLIGNAIVGCKDCWRGGKSACLEACGRDRGFCTNVCPSCPK